MRPPLHDWLARTDQDAFAAASSSWMPAVDIIEAGSGYVLFAELPGLSSEDLAVEAAATSVTLRGRRRSGDESCERYLRVERGQGEFLRSFEFPEPIDTTRISADFQNGVLRLELPKSGAGGPRRITIG